MAISSHTWAVSEVVSAANMNTYLRDNLSDLQSNKAVIKVGTYTGDGTTGQAITGVGFTPVWIKIYYYQQDGEASLACETTTNLFDNDAQGLVYYHQSVLAQMQDNQILTLDAGGFTVSDGGTNAFPNQSGSGYEYVCIGAE